MTRSPLALRRRAQTFVLFLVSFSTVFLLCGLALDSGLLYLDNARLSRACDAAVISGVKNFNKTKLEVANIMRNAAVANFLDLSPAPMTPSNPNPTPQTLPGGAQRYSYNYTSADGQTSVQIQLETGAGGQITLARAAGAVPHKTFFMSFAGLYSYNLGGSAEAVRRPRLITMVLDRSGSMVSPGGSTHLANSVTNFVSLFTTNADTIGIISFSSFARPEVLHTKNFMGPVSNSMYKAQNPQSPDHPLGMKFNGYTAAGEGIRLGVEMMRTNDGFLDRNTLKYLVFFTDGEFNTHRGLYATPCWTNIVYVPPVVTNGYCTNEFLMPTVYNDSNLDLDYTPRFVGPTMAYTNNVAKHQSNINVWLPPGAALYKYNSSGVIGVTWSRQTNTIVRTELLAGQTNMLVMPGYILDGVALGGTVNYDTDPEPRWDGNDTIYDGGYVSDGTGVYKNLMFMRNRRNIDGGRIIVHPAPYEIKPDGTSLLEAGSRTASRAQNGFAGNSGTIGTYYPTGRAFFLNNNSSWGGTSAYWKSSDNFLSYSTNMVYAVPHWGGGTFYKSNGQQINTLSMWQTQAPVWLTNSYNPVMALVTNAAAPSQIIWKPISYSGIPLATVAATNGWANPPTLAQIMSRNTTGGGMLVLDPATGTYSTNIMTMSYNARPQWRYDFKDGRWEQYSNGSLTADAEDASKMYCKKIREQNVTVYTVSFLSDSTFAGKINLFMDMSNDRSNVATFDAGEPAGKSFNTPDASQIPTFFQYIANEITSVITD
jgi:hypothetical protein